ncbi:C1 family peptidase [Legionella impletisoli]|uniref:Peptidase C1 n=1 Tax=Legionella impletisoli TaxID=343510 RepID=A0A917NDF7_9GAMM|nr:C1 family peptidase [Legionella impletisoli]GGI87144.1 peptidase C1 [Legionella impletisoli]
MKRLWLYVVFSLSLPVFAAEIDMIGELHQPLPQANKERIKRTLLLEPPREITLLQLALSDNAKETLKHRVEMASTSSNSMDIALANDTQRVQLGMNNVPVLDQGSHGTCATFANTAAIDALLGQGDYISQLCHLQLGRHLANVAYSPSGWKGSFGPVVLSQLDKFGMITKSNQQRYGCGGETEYPRFKGEPASEMSLPEYHTLSERLDERVAWSSLIDVWQAILKETDTSTTLADVKRSIREGDRVTFGVLLVDIQLGLIGAVGKHQVVSDTWVLTPEIVNDIKSNQAFNNAGGHEMIITGYDDGAIAVDNQGRRYQGLFTLRNSWGTNVGNQGDFYMTYDYFKVLLLEAQRIRKLDSQP